MLQDNISTSVVLELGLVEEDQDQQVNLVDHLDLTETLPNNQPTGEMEELKLSIHSRPTDSTPDGDKELSHAHTLWMTAKVLGGKFTSMDHQWLQESKSWTELTAVVVESTMLKCSLVADFVVWLETQDKVPG